MIEETRIYVVVAGTVQVPAPRRSVIQPPGRQVAQACHSVSMLRFQEARETMAMFYPITTIILQARDSAELRHVRILLLKKKLKPFVMIDTNDEAYSPGQSVMTALAVLATKKEIENILDYLPLWGAS